MVHHLKRGTALRERLTLTSLVSEVSPASLPSHTSDESKDPSKREGSLAGVTEANLFYPLCKAYVAPASGSR